MACAVPRPGAKPWECCGHAAALAPRGAGARKTAGLHPPQPRRKHGLRSPKTRREALGVLRPCRSPGSPRSGGPQDRGTPSSATKAQAWLAQSQDPARSLGSAVAMPQPWLPAERGPARPRDSILRNQGASMACAVPRPGAKPWECCGHAAALAPRGAGSMEEGAAMACIDRWFTVLGGAGKAAGCRFYGCSSSRVTQRTPPPSIAATHRLQWSQSEESISPRSRRRQKSGSRIVARPSTRPA